MSRFMNFIFLLLLVITTPDLYVAAENICDEEENLFATSEIYSSIALFGSGFGVLLVCSAAGALSVDHINHFKRKSVQIPVMIINFLPVLCVATATALIYNHCSSSTVNLIGLWKSTLLVLATLLWVWYALASLNAARGMALLRNGSWQTGRYGLLRLVMNDKAIFLTRKFFMLFGFIILLQASIAIGFWFMKWFEVKMSFDLEFSLLAVIFFTGLVLDLFFDGFCVAIMSLLTELPQDMRFTQQNHYYASLLLYWALQMEGFHAVAIFFEEFEPFFVFVEGVCMLAESLVLVYLHNELFCFERFQPYARLNYHRL